MPRWVVEIADEDAVFILSEMAPTVEGQADLIRDALLDALPIPDCSRVVVTPIMEERNA